ncbi:MAG TPA: tRNA uridine-5-carboxymethylaminomethyl(34) synthesis GTPase MnmE [Xanthomonadaceae bacterium]|nr:tRNA uridine-5-carboxymethylaminomethyl(34) synthesis GTPase MnmE [Xanthomonadaceae bacterium]
MTGPTDTIAAVATPPGRGGIGVLRLSGPEAFTIAERVGGLRPPARQPVLATFRDEAGAAIDRGLLLAFTGPASFTGEDVVELHAHGSPLVLAALLRRCLGLGARPARPGEFSERAFLNGKIDLAQAEAIADLIAAGSEAAARAAMRSLSGAFSARVDALLKVLVKLRVYVEAALDFPEEEIDFLSEGQVGNRVATLVEDVATLRAEAARGARLRDGLHVVLLGRPNAGKSSLLNALAGEDRAIVTEIPGTTRDLLREPIDIGGVAITVVDTAGLREAGDLVEVEGMRRARAEASRADLALLVLDAKRGDEADSLRGEVPAGVPAITVHNKIDLLDPENAAAVTRQALGVSARTGEGLDLLRDRLRTMAGLGEGSEGTFSARARHLDALARVAAHLDLAASHAAEAQGELLAEELRLAQCALGEITGAFSADQLLGEIFASFCIGK